MNQEQEESSLRERDSGLYKDSCSGVAEHYKIYLDALTHRATVIRRQEDEIKRLETELKLRAQGDDIDDVMPPKQLEKRVPAAQAAGNSCDVGDIAGSQSAARATPTGTAHAELNREAVSQSRRAARPRSPAVVAGGDTAAGSAAAHNSTQQPESSAGGERDAKQVKAALRVLKKAAKKPSAGTDGVTAFLAQSKGDWIRRILTAREIQLMRPAHLQHSVQKSVKSKRVAGGGGDSQKSGLSNVGGVPPVAAQGAAAECQGSTTAARSAYAAVVKRSKRDAEIDRLQRDNDRLQRDNRDLQQRLRDEKKLTNGVFAARQFGIVAQQQQLHQLRHQLHQQQQIRQVV